jgi:hypothetical protein
VPIVGYTLLAAVFILIMNKIDNFLNDLNALLEQYDAAIVRSAAENHKLVVSVGDKNGFVEYEFEEDITTHNIKVKDYVQLGSRF